jgi:dolichol-phosphate mannosyltransferase
MNLSAMDKDLIIVVPVYNEEASLQPLIEDWRNLLSSIEVSYQFLFIDDGSTDQSLAILKTSQQTSPDIFVLSQLNAGHGPAILSGYREACKAQWVLQIDSDHQLATGAFPELWRSREDYDLLLGQRLKKHAAAGRRLISSATWLLLQSLFGPAPKDVNCPYRLFRGPALTSALAHIPADSFAPNVLLTAWFVHRRMRILTIPVFPNDNIPPRKSKFNLYFLRGSLRALSQTILFKFRL